LDLLRVESDAEELPPHFPSSAVHSLVDYGRARIGAADALVPVSAELVAASFDGQLNRNRVRFTGCRQYGSSSSLHFEDLPAASAAALPAAKIWLPAGLTVEIRLRRGLNFDTDAAGDPVTASVEAAVTKAGQVILRKGAELRGRIRSLHQVLHPVPAVLIGIEFTDADYEDTRAFFRAVLDDVGPQTGLQLQRPQMQPGVCTFRALGTGVRLRAGLPMTLRTVATR
jgi:hypothetical protein